MSKMSENLKHYSDNTTYYPCNTMEPTSSYNDKNRLKSDSAPVGNISESESCVTRNATQFDDMSDSQMKREIRLSRRNDEYKYRSRIMENNTTIGNVNRNMTNSEIDYEEELRDNNRPKNDAKINKYYESLINEQLYSDVKNNETSLNENVTRNTKINNLIINEMYHNNNNNDLDENTEYVKNTDLNHRNSIINNNNKEKQTDCLDEFPEETIIGVQFYNTIDNYRDPTSDDNIIDVIAEIKSTDSDNFSNSEKINKRSFNAEQYDGNDRKKSRNIINEEERKPVQRSNIVDIHESKGYSDNQKRRQQTNVNNCNNKSNNDNNNYNYNNGGPFVEYPSNRVQKEKLFRPTYSKMDNLKTNYYSQFRPVENYNFVRFSEPLKPKNFYPLTSNDRHHQTGTDYGKYFDTYESPLENISVDNCYNSTRFGRQYEQSDINYNNNNNNNNNNNSFLRSLENDLEFETTNMMEATPTNRIILNDNRRPVEKRTTGNSMFVPIRTYGRANNSNYYDRINKFDRRDKIGRTFERYPKLGRYNSPDDDDSDANDDDFDGDDVNQIVGKDQKESIAEIRLTLLHKMENYTRKMKRILAIASELNVKIDYTSKQLKIIDENEF